MKNLYSAIVISVSLLISQNLFSQDGQLDPTFGQGGIVTKMFDVTGNCGINSTALQKDGKIVAAGFSINGAYYSFAVTRYNTDGSLDNSFGTNGVVLTPVSLDNRAQALTIQEDGMIVVAGFATVGAHQSFAVVRYTTNGALDKNFGSSGIVTTPVGTSYSSINSIKAQSDGKLVATGYSYATNQVVFAVVRYNRDGTPDNTFGTNGIVMTPVGSTNDEPKSLDIQDDGKIVVAGNSYDGVKGQVAVLRYNSNGTLDNTFATNGIYKSLIGGTTSNLNSVKIQNDGKILASGYAIIGTTSELLTLRLNSDGTLDMAFGVNGIVTTQSGNSATVSSVVRQNDGRILITGASSNGTDQNFVTARYNANGSVDNSFGTNGVMITSFGAPNNISNSVVVQNDGKILVSGVSGPLFNTRFTVIRYNTNGTYDKSFSKSGVVLTQLGQTFNKSIASTMQSDGKIIEAGYSRYVNSGSDFDFSVCRFTEEGKPDSTFGSNGISVTRIPGSDELGNSAALQRDGKIVVAGSTGSLTNSSIALIRYNTNGVQDDNFGTGGEVTIPIGNKDDARSVAIQNDGKIIAAGYFYNGNNRDIVVIRYDPSTGLDNTFGTNGIVKTPVGVGDDGANSVVIQNDGKIVIAGSSYNGTNFQATLVRYNTNGVADGTFGTDGVVTYPSIARSSAFASAIQSDGKIVVAGYIANGTYTNFAVFRYKSTGTLDSTFGINGIASTAVGNTNCQLSSIAIQIDGKILAGGMSYHDNVADFVILRYNKNGTIDNTFGDNGFAVSSIGNSQNYIGSLTIQKSNKIVASGYSSDGLNYSVITLVRYLVSQVTGISGHQAENSNSLILHQNYPNPFKGSTKITYDIPDKGFVTLKVFKQTGEEIKTLVDSEQNTGHYEVEFNSGGLDSGLYFCRLSAGNKTQTRVMIVSK